MTGPTKASLSVVPIGRALSTSPRTVGKHLEHVDAKLGRHDRVLVGVSWAV